MGKHDVLMKVDMWKICLPFYLFLLSITQANAFVNFVPHNQDTQTGDLQLARFCENLKVDDQIYQLTGTGGSGAYTFLISSQLADYVSVNERNGSITLINSFDREILGLIPYKAEVVAADGTADSVESYVVILDANDNAPVIKSIEYAEDIYEYPWTPSTLANISVVDDDSGTAGSFELSIEGTDLLYVESSFGATTSLLCNTSMELDYDRNPVVIATLKATDGGKAPCNPDVVFSTNQSLFFQVKDGPDQPPIFTTTINNIRINESEPAGTEIGEVFARDQDYGLDWNVVYDIVTDGTSEEFFQVSTDGKISVIKEIDRESLSTDSSGVYRFDIRATEVVPSVDPFAWKQAEVGYPFSTTTSVTVIILDQDDNIPIFYKLNDPTNLNDKIATDVFTTRLNEGTSTGSVVQELNIFVEDLDQDINAEFEVKLMEDDLPFEVSNSQITGSAVLTIVVKDSQKLDYEQEPTSFNFTIITTKRNSTLELSRANVFIELIDINDNSPIFNQTLLTFNVSENAEVGTWIGKIQATDVDSGIYGEITYGILLGNDLFQVSSDGNISVKSSNLDREIIPTYYVTFTATDGGNRTTIIPSEINLLDENDHPPEILREVYYSTMVDEDISTEVILQATDIDEGENGKVTFKIIPNEFSEYFQINNTANNMAILKPSKPLNIELIEGDCEVSDKHITLKVLAEDNGTPKLNSTVAVEITLQDINEFAPIFSPTNPTDVSVAEKSKLGTEIVELKAVDEDSCSPNNQIDFEIRGENSLNFIIVKSADNGINGTYGSLQVRNAVLDRDDQSVYNVTIIAIDLGNPRLSSTYDISVTLLDINDKPPQFNPTSLEDILIKEDSSPNYLVREVTAMDADETCDLIYNITTVECFDSRGVNVLGCEDWFNITTIEKDGIQVGHINVANEVDREKSQQIILTITVEDINATNGMRQIDAAPLIITLEDVNDQIPQFEIYDAYEVNEETNNTRIGQIRATDADGDGLNSEIIYSVAEEFQKYIQIDPNSGEFSTNDELDREVMGSYLNVTFIATDKGSPPLSSNETISIKIRDTNDQNPEILNLPNAVTISEDIALNTEIFVVTATDGDEGRNAELTFSLDETNLPFDIGRNTGIIQVVSKLDYERISSYQVTVRVTDNGLPTRLFTTKILSAIVNDTNDNLPRFTEDTQSQEFTVPEGSPSTTGIFIEEAFDEDSPELQTNYYYIVGGDGKNKFQIDRLTREIEIIDEVDRESNQLFQLVVQVSDVVNLTRSSDLTCDDVISNETFTCVLINVGDVNDEPPIFSKEEFVSDIAAETQPDSEVPIAQVYATDLDIGENARMLYSITNQQRCCPDCKDQDNVFIAEENTGDIYLVQAVSLENDCYFNINVRVTDGTPEHFDEAILKIGVIKDDQTVKLLSTISPSEWTTDKRSDFEEELGVLLGSTVIVDKVLPYKSELNPAIQSQVTFHAKVTGTNDLVETSTIDKVLDSGEPEVDVFLAKYGIKGRTITVTDPVDQTLQIIFMSISAVLLLLCVVLAISVVCMKQRINRNKRVERAMEKTFQDLERNTKSGAPNNYKTNDNPLYDISDDQPTLDIENPYDSTDDIDDGIDDNAIDNNDDSAIINDDEVVSSCGSVTDDFQIDFSSPAPELDKSNLAAALNSAVASDNTNINYAFQDTGF